MIPIVKASALSLLLLATTLPGHAQGPLSPGGAPAPSMKTLAQIEPRIDLMSPTLPAGVTTSANTEYIISQSGSYYLSRDIVTAKQEGISITATNVTLDLNGFRISRTSVGGSGITISAAEHCTVMNGTIEGFSNGINAAAGGSSRGANFKALRIIGCNLNGIIAGVYATVEDCTLMDGSGTAGLSVGEGGRVSRTTIVNYGGSFALFLGEGSSADHCVLRRNTSSQTMLVSSGTRITNTIFTSNTGSSVFATNTSGCTLRECMFSFNTATNIVAAQGRIRIEQCNFSANSVTGGAGSGVIRLFPFGTSDLGQVLNCNIAGSGTSATPGPSTACGIYATSATSIENCEIATISGSGIFVTAGSSIIRGNTVMGTVNGPGISIAGSSGVIERNQVRSCSSGISVTGTKNLITGNACAASTSVNYSIVANNIFGVVVDRSAALTGTVSGNAATSTFGTTDPYANIAY